MWILFMRTLPLKTLVNQTLKLVVQSFTQPFGLNFHLVNIFRWNQPVCPSMRPWSQSLTTRHTSASVKPRDAAGPRTSTLGWHSGLSERPLSFWWSASVRWCCWEASSLTRRPPRHVLDHNIVWALASDSSCSLSVPWLVCLKSVKISVLMSNRIISNCQVIQSDSLLQHWYSYNLYASEP